jgi:hypothetical protein
MIAVYGAPSSMTAISNKPQVNLQNVITGKHDQVDESQGTGVFDYGTSGLLTFFNNVSLIFLLISAYYAMVYNRILEVIRC